MKKEELLNLEEKVLRAVKEMSYGEYATTARLAYSIMPDAELDFDDLFTLEHAIYSLEETNEMVFDKFAHYNMLQGLPYNLDFVKLKNKGVPEDCCGQIEFRLEEDNLRRVIEGIIDFRTGRIVIANMGAINERRIIVLLDEERLNLAKLFIKSNFIEEEKEVVNTNVAISDGCEWSVTVSSGELDGHWIHGQVGDLSEIPIDGVRTFFESIKDYLGVLLVDIGKDNFDEYLSLYRNNSDYKKVYDSLDGLWESISKGVIKDYEEGETIGSLIYRASDMACCGYIEISECKEKEPSVNIVIDEKYRNQGIGYKASEIFIKQIFGRYDYSRIKWEAYESNTASRKIAQNVGGSISEDVGGVGSMFARLQEAAGITDERLKTVLYYIDREI